MSLGAVYTEKYSQLLSIKVERFKRELDAFALPPLSIFPSIPAAFRMRAEFRIWHKGARVHYVMFDPTTKQPRSLTSYPAGSTTIGHLMQPLLKLLEAEDVLRKRLFRVDFLTTRAGEALVTLVYHKHLDGSWQEAAERVQKQLGVHLCGRAKGQKHVFRRDFVCERFRVGERIYSYRQPENSFSQPNAFICEKMLSWVQQCCRKLICHDLLELYCGNGNFTCVLAPLFNRVLATELARESVRAARANLLHNQISNVEIVKLSALEVVQAMAGLRPFRRLRAIDLQSYAFNTLFVDPPRVGLDEQTLLFAKSFEQILYISCNLETLRQNMHYLIRTHRILCVALFDQFPYTEHIESGVVLVKR